MLSFRLRNRGKTMAIDPSASPSSSLVERAKNIILQPKTEWVRIDAEPATIGGLYRNYVVILAAIPVIALAVGSLLFGISLFVVTIRPPVSSVISTAVSQYVLTLVQVYVLALIIEALAPTFDGVKDRTQAVKLAAYAYTPYWVAGILLIMPALAILVLLAGLYCLYLCYLGLPILMKSAADKTIGYFIAIVVAAIILGIVVNAVTSRLTTAFTPQPANTISLTLRNG
jgi:hypothetical protein